MISKRALGLTVNGVNRELLVDDHRTLLEVLREDLRLTGTKHGCQVGECGACTVLVGGSPVLSCVLLAAQVGDRPVITIEGLVAGGRPHALQRAFAQHGAAQCGYCTPGMILSASALLEANRHPTRSEINHALSGNLCRCTGYNKIVEAVEAVSSGAEGP